MAKQTHNDVFSTSFGKTDFFKNQKELYFQNKQEIDRKRHEEEERKNTIAQNEMFGQNVCYQKAKQLSVKCVKICKRLMEKRDYVILSGFCSQLSRSSSSILANLSEGCFYNISYRDRINKFSISSKECYETISWISLLYEIGEITEDEYVELISDCKEIIKILSKSIETMKRKSKK